MTFLGDLVAALVHLAGHPREVRWGDVFFYMRRTGAEGFPIVGLISLLIGLIIAFMSSLQLKQFGANVYVASLVSLAIVRELGPIMTAILVAGRSASAYAAEIGTMRVNDEVDALVTMGFDPIRFLAVPKLIATVIVLPLLTLYADLFGIVGGLIVGVTGLDLTPYTYLQESQRTITLFYLVSSLVKALVFAFVIAWIGCQRGFQVRGGVEEVGAATTSAVVTSILADRDRGFGVCRRSPLYGLGGEKRKRTQSGWKEGPAPIIAVEGLTARFGEETILENVSFEVFRGEILCIVGGSGCGKSTLLKHMIGLIRPAAGRVLVEGVDIAAAADDELNLIRRENRRPFPVRCPPGIDDPRGERRTAARRICRTVYRKRCSSLSG